jgi:hypothetical protein
VGCAKPLCGGSWPPLWSWLSNPALDFATRWRYWGRCNAEEPEMFGHFRGDIEQKGHHRTPGRLDVLAKSWDSAQRQRLAGISRRENGIGFHCLFPGGARRGRFQEVNSTAGTSDTRCIVPVLHSGQRQDWRSSVTVSEPASSSEPSAAGSLGGGSGLSQPRMSFNFAARTAFDRKP